MKTYKCKQCGHEWIPRMVSPVMCPKCKSYRWNYDKSEDNKDD